MSDQIIPLSSAPNQTLSSVLDVDGNNLLLNFAVYFNEQSQTWYMDIADANNNPLLTSIPLVPGNYPAANLLGQYSYLEIGSAYLLNVAGVNEDHPSATDLGTSWNLIWSDTPEEVEAVA